MVVFLIETKAKSNKVKSIKRHTSFEGCFVIDSVGKVCGGLTLLWKYGNDVKIQKFSQCNINVWIKGENSDQWLFSGFYGHPNTEKRRKS